MEVALITEGTYPFHQGGVSVWCDQTIRALKDHQFRVYALTGSDTEELAWDLPGNVTDIVRVPLWSAARPPGRVRRRRDRGGFGPNHEGLLAALAPGSDATALLEALRQFAAAARAGDDGLAMGLRSSVAAGALLDVLADVSGPRDRQGGVPAPTVAEATEFLDLLDHYLRPLRMEPPAEALSHSVANGLGALLALSAKWAYGTPFLLTEHGLYLRERFLAYRPGSLGHHSRVLLLRFFKLLTEAAYVAADLIVPTSKYNQTWEEAGGADPAKIQPVFNGIEPAEFPASSGEPAVPTLVWVARIDPLKDVETLLRAFAILRRSLPEVRLRIFGSAANGNESYLRRCQSLAAELGVDGHACFEGRIESVVDAYQAGHVVLLTSISEGFPYVVIEAMASGRPVVATDVGGVREAVGSTGLIVPPRNPEAIANACLSLLKNEARRRSLGSAARRRVFSLFTVEPSTAAYRLLYATLVDISPAVAPLGRPAAGIPLPSGASSLGDSFAHKGGGAVIDGAVAIEVAS